MSRLIAVAVVFLVLLALQRKIYQNYWNKGLGVSVRFKTRELFEGERGELQEIIRNGKRLPLPMLKVKFQTSRNLLFEDTKGSRATDRYYRNDVFQAGAGEQITRTITFTGKKRGYYKIIGIDLVAADLFMTAEMTESLEAEDCYVYVYPKPYQSRELSLSLQQLNGEILTKRHLIEDPFEYRGIREYQPFDDMRSVNWKATARTGELKVNQKNYTSLKTIRLFFNIEDTGILKKEAAVEAALQIVAGVAESLLSTGIRLSVYGNGVDGITGEKMEISPSAGRGQMERIYKALARIDLEKDRLPFVKSFQEKILQEREGTMTVFVSPNAYEDFRSLLEQFGAEGGEYVWFYPIWEKEEPTLPDTVRSHVRFLHIRE